MLAGYVSNVIPDHEIKIGIKDDQIVSIWWGDFIDEKTKTPWRKLKKVLDEVSFNVQSEILKEEMEKKNESIKN